MTYNPNHNCRIYEETGEPVDDCGTTLNTVGINMRAETAQMKTGLRRAADLLAKLICELHKAKIKRGVRELLSDLTTDPTTEELSYFDRLQREIAETERRTGFRHYDNPCPRCAWPAIVATTGGGNPSTDPDYYDLVRCRECGWDGTSRDFPTRYVGKIIHGGLHPGCTFPDPIKLVGGSVSLSQES